MIADQRRQPDGAEPECPVCRWPDQGRPACGRCGMELRTGYVTGRVSPADEQELADRITAAQLRYDLRAAVRAASRTGECDDALLARLRHLVRGGPPLAHELDQAEAEFAAEAPRAPAAVDLGFTLSRLMAGEIDAIEFVEIGPESVSAQTLVVNDLFVPELSSSGELHPWLGLVPALPADDDLRRLQLAGGIGIGEADPAALTKAAETAVRQVVRQRLAATTATVGDRHHGRDFAAPGRPRARLDTVLVRRTLGWPLLDAAAARARAVVRPVAEIVDLGPDTLAELVEKTGRGAPLRYGYDLVLAEVNPGTGEVKAGRWPLFAPGTAIRRHDLPTQNAYVKAPPSAADQLALPVVMRRGAGVADWPAVGMATMPGSTPGTTQLQVSLLGPGRVSIQGRPDVVSQNGHAPGWPELLAGLPASVSAEIAVDLVLLVELGGSAVSVRARVALAAGVLNKLRRADTRVAVVGYRDHFSRHYIDAPAVRDRLIVGCGLEQISGARSVLNRHDLWQAVPVRDDYAAPVEDALHWVEEDGLAWRPDARHLLVVLASRPPHPDDEDDHANPKAAACPYHRGWREILRRLRGKHLVTCVAVRHEEVARGPADDDAEQAWHDFCADGFFSSLETSSADQLMTAIGLAADGEDPRLPLAARADAAASRPRRAGSA